MSAKSSFGNLDSALTNEPIISDGNEKTIDRIVNLSRLNELKQAINQIMDDNAIIIKGMHDNLNKAIKRGS